MNDRYILALGVAGLLAACSSDGAADDAPLTPSETAPSVAALPDDGPDDDGDDREELAGSSLDLADCERGSIEPDFMAAPLAGPAIEAGGLAPGEYLISSTYLQLGQDAEAQQLFETLIGPVVADLQTRAGLLALSLGSSAGCGTARTLAVWQDEAAMIGFVTGEAHGNAMLRVGDVSRGGSVVTHWVGDESSVDWAQAASRVGADDGPLY